MDIRVLQNHSDICIQGRCSCHLGKENGRHLLRIGWDMRLESRHIQYTYAIFLVYYFHSSYHRVLLPFSLRQMYAVV